MWQNGWVGSDQSGLRVNQVTSQNGLFLNRSIGLYQKILTCFAMSKPAQNSTPTQENSNPKSRGVMSYTGNAHLRLGTIQIVTLQQ